MPNSHLFIPIRKVHGSKGKVLVMLFQDSTETNFKQGDLYLHIQGWFYKKLKTTTKTPQVHVSLQLK